MVINSLQLVLDINPSILNNHDEEWLKQVVIRLRLTKSQSLILKRYLKVKKTRSSAYSYPLIPEFVQVSKSERNKLFINICEKLTT